MFRRSGMHRGQGGQAAATLGKANSEAGRSEFHASFMASTPRAPEHGLWLPPFHIL